MDGYSFNERLHIWQRDGGDNKVVFSDGDEAEKYILASVKKTKDRSVFSRELSEKIRDWPSEYHLSPLRCNLLRPFKFSKDDKVLELGCGCGAISRGLGETGASVTALEGNPDRAHIAALRCLDLSNVNVVCDNIESFKTSIAYDVVTLIGVLEYSRCFINGEDPVQRCLEKAFEFLGSEGSLVIAVENQLGLKYFNGHEEDHVSEPFFGIQDLYGQSGAITFGHREIARRLERAGFVASDFYFLFPDYKLPQVIFSEAGLATPGFRPDEILSSVQSRSYNSLPILSFDESLVYSALQRNELLGEMANSFLIVAHKDSSLKNFQYKFLAKYFSYNSINHQGTQATFFARDERIHVNKELIAPEQATPGDALFSRKLNETTYVDGTIYHLKLKRLLARGCSVAEIADWVKPWLSFLKEHCIESVDLNQDILSAQLPSPFVDCVPYNLLEDSSHALHYIDKEWEYEQSVPLMWVFIRGLSYSLSKCLLAPSLMGKKIRSIIGDVANILGLSISEEAYAVSFEMEKQLATHLYGNDYTSARPLYLEQVLNSTIHCLSSKREVSIQQLRHLGLSNQKLSEDNYLLYHDNVNLRKDNKALNERGEHLTQDNKVLGENVDILKRENVSLNENIKRLRGDNCSLHEDIELLKKDTHVIKERLDRRAEELEQVIRKKNLELESIMTSRSWKLTQPLRLLRERLR